MGVDILETGALQFFDRCEKMGGAFDAAIALQRLKAGVITIEYVIQDGDVVAAN